MVASLRSSKRVFIFFDLDFPLEGNVVDLKSAWCSKRSSDLTGLPLFLMSVASSSTFKQLRIIV